MKFATNPQHNGQAAACSIFHLKNISNVDESCEMCSVTCCKFYLRKSEVYPQLVIGGSAQLWRGGVWLYWQRSRVWH